MGTSPQNEEQMVEALKASIAGTKAKRAADPLSAESLRALKRALRGRYDGPESPQWMAGLLEAVEYAVEMVEDEES